MNDRTGNHSWPNIRRREGEEAPPASRIGDVAWIAGQWQGEAFGGMAEEMWSPPSGGSMMGMYKMVKEEVVVFYEFLTIVERGDSLLLRLKHFDASLKGWEEKDVSIEFPLVACTANEAYFDGLTFRLTDRDSLEAYVLLKHKDGGLEEVGFQYRRVGA